MKSNFRQYGQMEKQRWEESERRGSEERRSRCAKRWNSRKTLCFSMSCGSGGSKSRLAKAAGAEPSSEMRGEKLHGVVARSTFGSQHVQNTPFSDHFWKLTCRKCARRCGAKHVSKSKWAPRNKLQSQNVQSTPRSDHFWKLRCPKSALRCGAKHILKSTR